MQKAQKTGAFRCNMKRDYPRRYWWVDFHWGDYTYNLAGGGEILLSALLDAIGSSIEESEPDDSARLISLAKDLSRVENVTFSNEELMKVDKRADNDWLLTSLAAFDTEEILTIRFTDGSELKIRVTDVVSDTDVCRIGDTGYATLADVFAAAAGRTCTIEMLKDCELSAGISLSGTIYNNTNIMLTTASRQAPAERFI